MPSPTYWTSPTLPTPCTAAMVGSPTPARGWASRCPNGNNGSTASAALQPRYVPPPVDGTVSRRRKLCQRYTSRFCSGFHLLIDPGELYMSAHSTHGSITQRLNFTSASTALLRIEADTAEDLLLSGSQWGQRHHRQRRTELRHRPSSQWRNRDRDLYPQCRAGQDRQ